jgi:sodium-dependent dicarboxylate transporter 2/3/5
VTPARTASPHAKRPGQTFGLILGGLLFAALLLLPRPDGLSFEAWVCAGLLVLMATWWVTEALPIPITSLLPLVVLPMAGAASMREAAAPYFSPIVVLLLGGFIAATAVERWRLHERLALMTLVRAGRGRGALIGGFLVASALLSAWISNTATAIMLMPVALSVAYELGAKKGEGRGLTIALILAVAYGASIGGLATPVGTPTNLIVIGALEQSGEVRFSFDRWMMIGVPMVLLLLPAAWLVLRAQLTAMPPRPSGSGDPSLLIRSRLDTLGPWRQPEIRTFAVFGLMAFFWIFRRAFLQDLTLFGVTPFAGLSDALIAVAGSVLMFIVPSGCRDERRTALLEWETAAGIPWDVLLLFGGGLSLAAAITATGLGAYVGEELAGLTGLPLPLLVLALTVLVIFATEFTSNVATAATVMPVIIAMAGVSGMDAAVLALPVAMAASCAFMFPMATAPNAITYATGEISIAKMARVGLVLNLIGALLIAALVTLLTPFILG